MLAGCSTDPMSCCSLLNKLLHNLDSLLNRHTLSRPMHIIQINIIYTQPLQALLKAPLTVLRRRIRNNSSILETQRELGG